MLLFGAHIPMTHRYEGDAHTRRPTRNGLSRRPPHVLLLAPLFIIACQCDVKVGVRNTINPLVTVCTLRYQRGEGGDIKGVYTIKVFNDIYRNCLRHVWKCRRFFRTEVFLTLVQASATGRTYRWGRVFTKNRGIVFECE